MADRGWDRASSPPPPSAWLVRRACFPVRDNARSRSPFPPRPASSSADWPAVDRAAQNRNRSYGSPCILLRRNARSGVRPDCAGSPIQNYRTRPSFPVGNCRSPTRRRAGLGSCPDSATTDRRREKEIARPAIAADRTDVIGLLPLSADDQRHFVFLAVLGRARISRVDDDEKKFAVAVFGSHIELYGNVLQFCQIGIVPLCHGANVLEGDDRVVEIALDRLSGRRREDFRMPGRSPLCELLIVTSAAFAAFAADIGGAFEVFLA